MLKRIIAATTLPVSVTRAKERLRIDTSDFDHDLEVSIQAATTVLETQTGLVLQPSSFEYRTDSWCDVEGVVMTRSPYGLHFTLDRGPAIPFPHLNIPSAPIRDVTGITYLDENDAEQTVASDQWSWERTESGATITFSRDFVFPTVSVRPQSVRVAFDAGFDDPASSGSGDDPDLKLPGQAEMALLFLVGHWHEFRQSVVVDSRRAPFEIPQTFDYLAAQLRIYR